MSEHFDEWNIVKKETDRLTSPIFKEREVYYTRMARSEIQIKEMVEKNLIGREIKVFP